MLIQVLTVKRVLYDIHIYFRKAERSLRVVRAQLDSGERLIGIRYPESLISLVGKKAGEEPVQEIVSASRIAWHSIE